jgi:hypothetical protein
MNTPYIANDAHIASILQQRECGVSYGPVMSLDAMQILGRELDQIRKNREKKDADFAQRLYLQLNGGGASGGHGGAVRGGRGGASGGTNRVGIGAVRGAGIGRADAMTEQQLESWLAEGGGRGGTNRVGSGAVGGGEHGAGIGHADAMTNDKFIRWLAEGGGSAGVSAVCGGRGSMKRIGSNAGYDDSASHNVILFTRCPNGIRITSVPHESWWRNLHPGTIVTHIGGIDICNQRITDATIRNLLQTHWLVIIVGGHERIAELS